MVRHSSSRAKSFISVALAGLMISAAQGSAHASEWESKSIKVSTSGLDLRAPAGAAALRQRVLVAANKVCGWLNPDDPINSETFGDCVHGAVSHTSPPVATVIAAAQGVTTVASAAGPSR
jgi:UrcA family protein